jgi:hypothetical protein
VAFLEVAAVAVAAAAVTATGVAAAAAVSLAAAGVAAAAAAVTATGNGGSGIIGHKRKIIRRGGGVTRGGLCEQQRLTVIPPNVHLVIAVIGRRRHGHQHGVRIRRTLQLPTSSCWVGTGQEGTRGPQHAQIITQ